MQKTMELALGYKEQTIALRREFHQNPEPSGEEGVSLFPLQMGGEDYSFMMEKVPDSLIAFVGIGDAAKGTDQPHHAGNFQIDEDCLPISAALYAQFALDYLAGR